MPDREELRLRIELEVAAIQCKKTPDGNEIWWTGKRIREQFWGDKFTHRRLKTYLNAHPKIRTRHKGQKPEVDYWSFIAHADPEIVEQGRLDRAVERAVDKYAEKRKANT
jgi:hypothetical protein